MAVAFKKTNQSTQEVKNECILISTRQNDLQIFRMLKATYSENVHIVLSCRYQKAFIFNLLCVLISFGKRFVFHEPREAKNE